MAITQEELARRLKAARENAGLTQQGVAEEIGITRLAVLRIEAGKRAVNSLELAEMAQLYGRGLGEFFVEGPFEDDPLVALFRAAPEYEDDPDLRRELLKCVDLCREAANLERLLSLSSSQALVVSYGSTAPSTRWEAISQGRRLAEQERNRLDLGTSPIREIAEIIARQGVRVTEYGMPDAVSGIFFHKQDLGFAIVVNERHSRTRQMFSYAHEYCHLLADRERPGGISHAGNRNDLSEVRANAFAVHFLAPEPGVRTLLSSLGKGESARQNLEIYDEGDSVPAQKRMPAGSQELRVHEVVIMSRYFGVSYEAMLYQLLNLRILRKGAKFDALMEQKESAPSIRRTLRLSDFDDESRRNLPDPLTEQLLSLGIEAYRREEISRGKLFELAEKVDVGRDEIEEMLRYLRLSWEPLEVVLPGE